MSFAGGIETLFVILLAFIIIGPKDLPKILFALGRLVKTIRHLSAEFMAEFENIHHLKEIEDNRKKKKKAN